MRGTAQPTGEVEGRYCVYVVELRGGEGRLIYANPSSDVRSVWPRLSSDGRFVVMKDNRCERHWISKERLRDLRPRMDK